MIPDGHAAAVIVLAAGEGSRMRSAMPKVLHPVAGRPLVEHAVRAAAGLDPQHLAVVVGHGREAVTAHLQAVAAVLGRAIDAQATPHRPRRHRHRGPRQPPECPGKGSRSQILTEATNSPPNHLPRFPDTCPATLAAGQVSGCLHLTPGVRAWRSYSYAPASAGGFEVADAAQWSPPVWSLAGPPAQWSPPVWCPEAEWSPKARWFPEAR